MYKNPTPVVVALLKCGGGLVAVQRAIPPKLGEWAFPGGYVDEGENAAEAASREVLEETGLMFEPELWYPVDTLCTPNNQLLIFMGCDGEVKDEDLEKFVPTSESSAIKVVFSRDELCFPMHTQMLKRNLGEPEPVGSDGA